MCPSWSAPAAIPPWQPTSDHALIAASELRPDKFVLERAQVVDHDAGIVAEHRNEVSAHVAVYATTIRKGVPMITGPQCNAARVRVVIWRSNEWNNQVYGTPWERARVSRGKCYRINLQDSCHVSETSLRCCGSSTAPRGHRWRS